MYVRALVSGAAQIGSNFHMLTQNSWHGADEIFICILLNEKSYLCIKMLLKFVAEGPLDNTPVLVQVMYWPRTGGKENLMQIISRII